jgi:hypothetical protein
MVATILALKSSKTMPRCRGRVWKMTNSLLLELASLQRRSTIVKAIRLPTICDWLLSDPTSSERLSIPIRCSDYRSVTSSWSDSIFNLRRLLHPSLAPVYGYPDEEALAPVGGYSSSFVYLCIAYCAGYCFCFLKRFRKLGSICVLKMLTICSRYASLIASTVFQFSL